MQRLWFAEGAVEEAAGLWRIPLPLGDLGLRAVNVYLLEDDDGFTLVDCGTHRPESLAALDAALAGLGVRLSAVRRLVSTHVHHDHFGQARRLRASCDAQLFLGAGERASLRALQYGVADRELWSETRAAELGDTVLASRVRRSPAEPLWETQPAATWAEPDVWLSDGDVITGSRGGLRAIETPGHTAGHISLLALDGGLYAGDHVLPRLSPSIGFEPVQNASALEDFLMSLVRVRDEQVSMVWPAHGAPFTDLAGRVDELLAHHETRLNGCLSALEDAPKTVAEVAAALPWTRRSVRFDSLDDFNRLLALYETEAHMSLLKSGGLVIAAGRRFASVAAGTPVTAAALLQRAP